MPAEWPSRGKQASALPGERREEGMERTEEKGGGREEEVVLT